MFCHEQTLSVADILRDQVGRLHLDHKQGKAAAHIMACRTGRLGGHRAVCDRCGAEHYAFHSCRNRHCPRCAGLDQRLWAEAQLPHLLPVSYFHVVFTVPVSLRCFRRPFGGPEQVVTYFARYVRKMAISDHRLVDYDGQTVHFHYRDRRDNNRVKTAKLEGPQFCRLFLQHVLPKGFVRIRRYGLLSNRVRKPLLARCREVLGADPPLLLAPPDETRAEALRRIFGFEPKLCPACKTGRLIVRAQWRAKRRPLEAILDTLPVPRGP